MSEFRYRQPANEYAFEDFCLVLMRDVWKLPTLEQFGHRGERQHGVDLLDLGESIELRGVQCKHHESHKTLPPAELEEEISKAKTLPDEPLSEFWVLTTAKKSAATQRKVREINRAHAAKGLFRVAVKFWDDIERLIDTSPAAQRHLELRTSEAVVSATRQALSEVIAPLSETILHTGLDEATAHLTKGELPEALLVLRKVRAHAWVNLSSAQKARWLTLRADIALRQGKNREAAESLLEAHSYTPDDERAVANAVVAKRLLNDTGAATIAIKAREQFPLSAVIWAAQIDSATSTQDALSILDAMPEHLNNSPEVILAIAGRTDLHTKFPDILERSVEVAPKDVRAWFQLGAQLLSVEAEKLNPESWALAPIDESRTRRAIDSFSKAIGICEQESRPALRVEALLQRSLAFRLVEDLQNSRNDIESAAAIDPSSAQVRLARVRVYLADEDYSSAISLLRELVQRENHEQSCFMLASALWNRNAPGDRNEATTIMKERAERGDTKGLAHMIALDGLLAARRLDEAKHFVAQSATRLGATEQAVLEGRLYLAANDRERASSAAAQALAALPPDASRQQVARVSRLLVQVGRFQEALPLLVRLCADSTDLDSIQALVLCASRLGRHEIILTACARCRDLGIYDEFLLSNEIPLLERYDPERAVSALDSFLASDRSRHAVRVHLVELAQCIERDDIVLREAPSLPSVTEVSSAEEGAAMVRILQRMGKREDALNYSYDLLRRFFANHHAHRAFIHATLWRDRSAENDAELLPPRVEPGIAICLQESGDRETRWLILEDSAVEDANVEHEILPSHPLWTQLLGRQVGNEVDLASGRGPSRKARIVELLPKKVFRFRESMDRWQYKFSTHQELWTLRTHNDVTGEPDVSQIIEFAKSQRKNIEQAEEAYRSTLLPVGMFGQAIGKNIFYAALHVATTQSLPMRCCMGTLEERNAALQALDAATELVLDGTALCTLYLLDLLEALQSTTKRLLVTHSTMALVRSFVHGAQTTTRATAGMGMTSAGPALHLYTDAEKSVFHESATRFKTALEQIANVCPSTELANMLPELRRQLEQIIDMSTLDTAAVATAPGRLLWTDDGVIAHLARAEIGTSSVWTQSVLLWLLRQGLIDETAYSRASANLVVFNYAFTSVSPAIVLEAARMSQWSPEWPPLKQMIGLLSNAAVRFEDSAQLAATLIKDAFAEPISAEQRRAIMFFVCDALFARSDADSALEGFEKILPRAFGVNLIGQAQAAQALQAWKHPPQIVSPDHKGLLQLHASSCATQAASAMERHWASTNPRATATAMVRPPSETTDA